MSFRFLSFGAGVQTTALLLMDSYDEVIFADTGGEHPETYRYLQEYVLPYCEKERMKFTTVRAKETLEAFCLRRKTTPSLKYRFTTRDFKIRPMERYIKASNHMGAVSVVGISYDEAERMSSIKSKFWTVEYPLIEQKMRRKNCETIIEQKGWPLPRKSGCFYCPYMPMAELFKQYQTQPDLWARRKAIEENSKYYPKQKIHSRLTTIQLEDRFGKNNRTLTEFIEAPCDNGACFT